MKNEKNITELNSQYIELTDKVLEGVSGGADEEDHVDWLSVGTELARGCEILVEQGIGPDVVCILFAYNGNHDVEGIKNWCYAHMDAPYVQDTIARYTR